MSGLGLRESANGERDFGGPNSFTANIYLQDDWLEFNPPFGATVQGQSFRRQVMGSPRESRAMAELGTTHSEDAIPRLIDEIERETTS